MDALENQNIKKAIDKLLLEVESAKSYINNIEKNNGELADDIRNAISKIDKTLLKIDNNDC